MSTVDEGSEEMEPMSESAASYPATSRYDSETIDEIEEAMDEMEDEDEDEGEEDAETPPNPWEEEEVKAEQEAIRRGAKRGPCILPDKMVRTLKWMAMVEVERAIVIDEEEAAWDAEQRSF